jgi:hypothetical protein
LFAYFLEAGLALLVVPWTAFWERNYFIEGTVLGLVLGNHAVRGAISGVGAVCLAAAIAELWACRPWRPMPDEGPTTPSLDGSLHR